MTGQNIICFAKDWNESPTSNNHVMVELAKGNRVLWLNSIGTRRPTLSSGRDFKKVVRKLREFFGGARRVRERMWVYTPVVLPFPHSRIARRLNQWALRAAVGSLRRRLGMREFQLWTFIPNAVDYVGSLGESLVVYYCVDEWSKFDYVNARETAAAERRLLQRADVVFATAQSLVDDRRPLNRETYLSRHGVDHALFSAALSCQTLPPPDVGQLPKPIIGFFGTVQNWVDFRLIRFLAERHPEWTFVLIGSVLADASAVTGLPNVHLLGPRPHGELPNYCKAFSVGIIPYVLNERILHVNPLKLREYLCAGLPVVSVALPELEDYRGLCTIAGTYEAFEQGVAEAIRTDSPELRHSRSESMRSETWERRVAEVGAQVMRAWERRNGGHG